MAQINPIIKEDIVKLYIAMFQRIPSKSEIDYWYSSANNNGLIKGDNLDVIKLSDTMADAAKNAVQQYNLEDLYPQYANYDPHNEESVKSVINSVYKTIFNKDETQDPDGVQYWTNQIVKNGESLGEVIVSMENAAKDIEENPDKYKNSFSPEELENALKAVDAFNSKVEAAEKASDILTNVKIDSTTLKDLQNLVKEVNDNSTEQVVLSYIEDNKDKFLNQIDNTDNLSVNDDSSITPPQLPSLNEDNSDLPLL